MIKTNILVINAGSSSLKYQLIDMRNNRPVAKGLAERIGIDGSRLKHCPEGGGEIIIEKPMSNHSEAISLMIGALIDPEHGVIKSLGDISAVGHRVVHGGERFKKSVLIDKNIKKAIEECFDLAPLHNPPNLIGINACEEAMPNVPQVAVFDTAFHQTMPQEAFLYAIPYKLYEKYKIRKYGFHGTSHKYVANRAAELLGKPIEQLKLITLHLGNGSSVAAVRFGRSVETSMGFTPLSGVLMGTRSGDIDPAIVAFLMDKEKMTAEQVTGLLNKESGVLGISKISSDFRDIEQASDDGQESAALSLNMFAYSIKKYIGAYIAIMNGVDAIIFTAGIGENNATMRERICSGLDNLGIKLDHEKNMKRGIEIDISAEDATVQTLVVPTNEELMIAIEAENLLP